MRHLVLHLRQPLAQLLVLLVEDDPGVQTVRDLLFTQRHLKHRGAGRKKSNQLYYFKMLSLNCVCLICLINNDAHAARISLISFELIVGVTCNKGLSSCSSPSSPSSHLIFMG